MKQPVHIVAVAALVCNRNGTVLLTRHPGRGWEFPGGQVEPGEDLIAALKREVKEETGITISVGRLVSINSNVKPEGVIPTKVMFDFLTKTTGGELASSAESPKVGWFEKDRVLALITHPMIRDRMKLMLAFNDRIIYRSYSKNPYRVHQKCWVS